MLTEEQDTQANSLRRKLIQLAWGITGVTMLSCAAYIFVSTAIKNVESIENYQNNCQVFLQRASRAGTVEVARKELRPAIRWLAASNYPKDSFEYRDLKGNVEYLDSQPPNFAVPQGIKDSLSKNTESLDTFTANKDSLTAWEWLIVFGLAFFGIGAITVASEWFQD